MPSEMIATPASKPAEPWSGTVGTKVANPLIIREHMWGRGV